MSTGLGGQFWRGQSTTSGSLCHPTYRTRQQVPMGGFLTDATITQTKSSPSLVGDKSA